MHGEILMLFVNSPMTRHTNDLDILGCIGFLMPFPAELLEGNKVVNVKLLTRLLLATDLASIIGFLFVSLSKLRIARAIVGHATLPFGRLISLWAWLAGFAREKDGIEKFGLAALVTEVPLPKFHQIRRSLDSLATVGANGFNLIHPSGMIAHLATIFAAAPRLSPLGVANGALKGGATMGTN